MKKGFLKYLVDAPAASRKTKKGRKSRKPRKRGVGRVATVGAATGVRSSSRLGGTSRRVMNRELVGSLTAAATPNYQLLGKSNDTPGYDLNPGNSILFPWLWSQAICYDKYRFHRCRFILVHGVGSSTNGRVHMGFDYDYLDSPPQDLGTAMNAMGAKSCSVWQTLELDLDIRRLNEGNNGLRYVTTTATPNYQDARLAYGGFLYVAATGATAGAVFELYVEYDVELVAPQLPGFLQTGNFASQAMPLTGVGSVTPINIAESSTSTLPRVVSGVTAPVLTGPAVAFPGGTTALDVSGITKGLLSIQSEIGSLVGAPTTTAVNCMMGVAACDRTGAYLGAYHGDYPLEVANFGSKDTGQWAAAGQPITARAVLNMALWKLAKPTISYLVPYVYNIAAKAAEVNAAVVGANSPIRFEL